MNLGIWERPRGWDAALWPRRHISSPANMLPELSGDAHPNPLPTAGGKKSTGPVKMLGICKTLSCTECMCIVVEVSLPK